MERDLLHRLLDQAFLYDDPFAYRAGVQAAWGALNAVREAEPPAPAGFAPHPHGASHDGAGRPARATG